MKLKIGFTLRGDYDSTVTYDILDVVKNNNNYYVSKVTGNTAALTDSTKWELAVNMSDIITAEEERVSAESKRTSAELERDAAENEREAALVQVTGSNTDKVMSQKAVTDALANYVLTVQGKGLSTNDLTDELLSKLNGLSNYDDTTVKANVTSLQTQLNTLVSGSASTAIDTFNEIIAFLKDVSDSTTLEGIIAGINTTITDSIAAHNDSTSAHSDIRTLISNEVTARIDGDTTLQGNIDKKVDKVEGKGLSANDYTDKEKSSVSKIDSIIDVNTIEDTVVAEAISKLFNELNGLKTIITDGNLGDIHVKSITSDSVPKVCGQDMIMYGSGSPVTNAVLADFNGQIYVDTTNRNVYMCADSSSSTYWKQLN